MILGDDIVRELVREMMRMREFLQTPQTPFDRLLTIQDVCARWQITPAAFHKRYRHVLPNCAVISDPRYRLSDIVRYDQERMHHGDGTPFDAEALKRPARRRAPSEDRKAA